MINVKLMVKRHGGDLRMRVKRDWAVGRISEEDRNRLLIAIEDLEDVGRRIVIKEKK